MAKPFNRHISFRLSDKDAIARLEKLDEPIAEFMRRILMDYLDGHLVDKREELGTLDSARLTGYQIENKIKQKRLDTFDEMHDLKKQKLTADIDKSLVQGELADVALARLTSPVGDDGYRYILPQGDGLIRFMCPHCGKTIAECDTYRAHRYLPNKLKLVNHLADAHQIPAYKFDEYTLGFFTRLELKIFQKTFPATPLKTEYLDGQFFEAGPKELPSP